MVERSPRAPPIPDRNPEVPEPPSWEEVGAAYELFWGKDKRDRERAKLVATLRADFRQEALDRVWVMVSAGIEGANEIVGAEERAARIGVAIRRLNDEGASVSAISRAIGLAERWVKEFVYGAPND